VGAALTLTLLAGFAPAANAGTQPAVPTVPTVPAAPSTAVGPGPDEDHVNLLDLDDLVDDLLFLLGLRDHGSNETSLLDELGLTDEDGDEAPPAPEAPEPPAAPAPPELTGIIPTAPPGGEAPAPPEVTPEDLATLPEINGPEITGLQVPGIPPSG